jgi:anti-sigma factor RsiW
MMVTHSSCPPEQTLADFVLGRLADLRHGQIATHLAECDRCVAVLARLDAPSDCLRPIVETEREEPPPLLLERLRHIPQRKGTAYVLDADLPPVREGPATPPTDAYATPVEPKGEAAVPFAFRRPSESESGLGWLGRTCARVTAARAFHLLHAVLVLRHHVRVA